MSQRAPTGDPLSGPSAQWPERRSDLNGEQLGLFPGGEVTAPGGLVEVGEGGVGLLDPAARGAEDLAGEGGEADRDRDLRRRPARRCGWVEKVYPSLSYFREADKGGHFAAWEEPELFATEIRAAFKKLR